MLIQDNDVFHCLARNQALLYNKTMRRFFPATLIALALFLGLTLAPRSVEAQQRSSPNPTITPAIEATLEAQIATPEAVVVETPPPKTDITEPSVITKSRLARFLDEMPVQPLGPTNFVQHAIRTAVNQGVPANVLVLLLLFPVIASLIAASRHVIGLQGFGVYIPAVLSVALLSTGIITGIILFVAILIAAGIGRSIFRKFHLQYLPRTALTLWLVSLVVFGLLLLSPLLAQFQINLISVTIFPILVVILLSENFLEAQLAGSQSRAIELTIETIILAVISALFMRTEEVQRFVIIYPELTILAVFILDIVVGRFTGLRLSEYLRFRPILDPEE
jgi:hypothetical protein